MVNYTTTSNQAGGKQRSWGCIDQLLTNKMKLYKTKHHHCQLLMKLFVYKKLSDCVPHSDLENS